MPENEQNVQNEQEQKIILQHQNRRRKHKIKLAVESSSNTPSSRSLYCPVYVNSNRLAVLLPPPEVSARP